MRSALQRSALHQPSHAGPCCPSCMAHCTSQVMLAPAAPAAWHSALAMSAFNNKVQALHD
jgi:hypothetical protein